MRSLVGAGAIGIVTTHDLALTRVAGTLGDRADNVHFQDHLEDGVIAFDYRMHPGVVTKSNALELMRRWVWMCEQVFMTPLGSARSASPTSAGSLALAASLRAPLAGACRGARLGGVACLRGASGCCEVSCVSR